MPTIKVNVFPNDPQFPPSTTEFICDCGFRMITPSLCVSVAKCGRCGKVVKVKDMRLLEEQKGCMMKPECNHKFVYGGVKFEDLDHQLAGSGARPRRYYDWFYCEKCLESQFKKLDCFDDNTYGEVRFSATPLYEVIRGEHERKTM